MTPFSLGKTVPNPHSLTSLVGRALRRIGSDIGFGLSRLGSLITVKASRPYHPLGIRKRPFLARPDQAFEQRWQWVSHALSRHQAGSFLDLGCAEGYYVRRAAGEHGVFSIGIENSRQRMLISHACMLLDNDQGSGFVEFTIDTESIRKIPAFDVVACMSLMHHIIHHQGIDTARELLSAISGKVNKCFLFDMGSPEETENVWAGSLSMFSGDVEKNTAKFLQECSFSNVELAGWTTGYRTTAKRPFFIADK